MERNCWSVNVKDGNRKAHSLLYTEVKMHYNYKLSISAALCFVQLFKSNYSVVATTKPVEETICNKALNFLVQICTESEGKLNGRSSETLYLPNANSKSESQSNCLLDRFRMTTLRRLILLL